MNIKGTEPQDQAVLCFFVTRPAMFKKSVTVGSFGLKDHRRSG